MRFRPCIDLHAGAVKQIVGSTLSDDSESQPITNFQSSYPASYYATLYKTHDLSGGHIIMLGSQQENQDAAIKALLTYPYGLQIGGGITPTNAKLFIDNGASHIIVTSYVFRNGIVDFNRLNELVDIVGKDHLVLDLSCRKKKDDCRYFVMTDRWQNFTDFPLTKDNLIKLSDYCDEFLVHAVDVEGKRCGIMEELVLFLGENSPIPVTYAGGVNSLDELDKVKSIGKGKVDLSIGSALDIFGGSISFQDVVSWQKKVNNE